MSRSLCGHMLPFLWSKYLRVEWLSHVAGVHVTGEETHLVALFCVSLCLRVSFSSFDGNLFIVQFLHAHMFYPLTE